MPDTWGMSSEEIIAIREAAERREAEEKRQENEARNRAIITSAFVNAEHEIVNLLDKLIDDVKRGVTVDLTAKGVAWHILDTLTKH